MLERNSICENIIPEIFWIFFLSEAICVDKEMLGTKVHVPEGRDYF